MKKNKNKIHFFNIEKTLDNIDGILLSEKYKNSSGYDRLAYKTAIATCLGQIYNGIEKILEDIIKKLNITIDKNSGTYHKNLLKTLKNKKIISDSIYLGLDNFRRFRHLYRHGYAHNINEKKVVELAQEIKKVYPKFKQEYDNLDLSSLNL